MQVTMTHCVTCYKNMIFDANNDGAKEATDENVDRYGGLRTQEHLTSRKTTVKDEIEFYMFYKTKKAKKVNFKIISL